MKLSQLLITSYEIVHLILKKKSRHYRNRRSFIKNEVDNMKLKNQSLKALSKKTLLMKLEMIYIEESFSLNKKEFERYVIDHKEYFIITIEKLRSEIIIFITYIYHKKNDSEI